MANFYDQINQYKNGESEVKQICRFIFELSKVEKKITQLMAELTLKNSFPDGKVSINSALFKKKFTDQAEIVKNMHENCYVNLDKLGHDVLEMSKVNFPKNTFGNLEIPSNLIKQFEKVYY
jgi:repressor of nif and glnA expression